MFIPQLVLMLPLYSMENQNQNQKKKPRTLRKEISLADIF